jgi:helix-turn-helix protein
MVLVLGFWTFLRAVFFGSAAVALENVALRHQLRVLQRSVSRPRLARWDRILWVWLSRVWVSWRSSLVIVQPATVRRGFQLYWRWESWAPSVGRPRLDPELRRLIRRMARENPTWGRRRIRAELALLGYHVAELTVAKYMRRTSRRPSPTWRAFLAAHLRDMVAVDFFVVPTLTFRLLFVFVVLRHDRRELLPSQRHRSCYGRLDGPADRRGVPGGHGSGLPASGSRHDLRGGVLTASYAVGHARGAHRSQSALAESVRGASHRVHPSRMSRPLLRAERGASPPALAQVSRRLQPLAPPSSARQQQPPPAKRPTIFTGPDCSHSSGRRAPSPLPARRLATTSLGDAPRHIAGPHLPDFVRHNIG